MKYRITGVPIVDYGVIPGLAFGLLSLGASLLGASGANVIGEGMATAGIASLAVWLIASAAAFLLGYAASGAESKFTGVLATGVAFGLSKGVIGVMYAAFTLGSAPVDAVDGIKLLALMALLGIIWYAALYLGGIALWVLSSSFSRIKSQGRKAARPKATRRRG